MQKSRLVEIKMYSKEKKYCIFLLSQYVKLFSLFNTYLPKENIYLFTFLLSKGEYLQFSLLKGGDFTIYTIFFLLRE